MPQAKPTSSTPETALGTRAQRVMSALSGPSTYGKTWCFQSSPAAATAAATTVGSPRSRVDAYWSARGSLSIAAIVSAYT